MPEVLRNHGGKAASLVILALLAGVLFWPVQPLPDVESGTETLAAGIETWISALEGDFSCVEVDADCPDTQGETRQ